MADRVSLPATTRTERQQIIADIVRPPNATAMNVTIEPDRERRSPCDQKEPKITLFYACKGHETIRLSAKKTALQ
jgi:hypothetical protein